MADIAQVPNPFGSLVKGGKSPALSLANAVGKEVNHKEEKEGNTTKAPSPKAVKETALSGFVEQASVAFINNLLAPICSWLKDNKEVDVTPEELIAAVNLPKPKVVSAATNLGIPSFLRNAATLNSEVKAKPAAKTRKKSEATGPQCEYSFQRPPRKGERCVNNSEALDDGFNFCKECRKRQQVKAIIAKGKPAGGDGKGTGKALYNTMVTAAGLKSTEGEEEVNGEGGDPPLTLDEYKLRPGLFIDKEGYISIKLLDGQHVVLKKLDNGVERDLTTEEIDGLDSAYFGVAEAKEIVKQMNAYPLKETKPSPAVAKGVSKPAAPKSTPVSNIVAKMIVKGAAKPSPKLATKPLVKEPEEVVEEENNTEEAETPEEGDTEGASEEN